MASPRPEDFGAVPIARPEDFGATKIDMADRIPGQKPGTFATQYQGPKPVGGIANAAGPLEAALSLGSGAVAGLVAPIAGVARTLTGGKFGTQEGIQQGQDTIRNVMDAMTYRPRTALGQDITGTIGGALSASKIAGIGPAEALPLATLAGPALRQAYEAIPSGGRIPRLMTGSPQPQMVGVGAAETSAPLQRIERAEGLPIPVKLTKGQALRTFEQQQFEREAAKNPAIGEPLRQRFAQQNQQIPQNLEFFADQTGAEAGSVRATGEIVTNAIAEKANAMKGKINAAYKAARDAGELSQPIDATPLRQYLESNKPQSINAGVLSSTLGQLDDLTKNTGGRIAINDLEEIRKNIGIAGGKDATNAHFARELKTIVDDLTKNAGGKEYQYARRLRANYAKEFENVGIVDRLMSTKPGTSDRAIAFEDVFNKSIMGGSLDDVRAIRKTLQTAGPTGDQAWKELQGATVNHIKEEITKNAQRDINGSPVVSPAAFNKVVTGLDKDGKLDFIFGKQGAQKIRDLRDTTMDAMTSPPGSVNTSNTSSAILSAIDSFITKLPIIGMPIEAAKDAYKNAQLGKRVQQSLIPIPQRK